MRLVFCSLVERSTNRCRTASGSDRMLRARFANFVAENLASVGKSASDGPLLQDWEPVSGRSRPRFYTVEPISVVATNPHAGCLGDRGPLPALTFLSESIYYFSQTGV